MNDDTNLIDISMLQQLQGVRHPWPCHGRRQGLLAPPEPHGHRRHEHQPAGGVIEDESIVLLFNNSVSPCLIKPVSGDSFEYLVLPVRLGQ